MEPDPDIEDDKRTLQEFLYEQVYRHPDLMKVRREAQQQLRELFDAYVAHPKRLPVEFQRRVEQVGIARGVADYLAGMTDRFCHRKYREVITG